MSATQHFILIPGFFGFTNLGDLAYFGHVEEFLNELCRRQRIEAQIRVVKTFPTSSLRRRAARVLDTMAEALDETPGVVHLIGHSSGGLDARLAVTPEVSLPSDRDAAKYAQHVRSVVTISAPHHGTSSAEFFASLLGQQLLRVFSVSTIYALRTGRLPMAALLRLLSVFVSPKRTADAASTAVGQLYYQLLADFSSERRDAIELFFRDVGNEQDLLPQITPAAMDLFNASTDDRPNIRYGCVLSRAQPPGPRSVLRAGISPYRQATHALYVALYRIASGLPRERAPTPTRAQEQTLMRVYGKPLTTNDNDGMVPTISQLWGELIHAASADHLDVIGHFQLPTHVPPHFDWLNSGTHFTRYAFEAVWSDVVAFTQRSIAEVNDSTLGWAE